MKVKGPPRNRSRSTSPRVSSGSEASTTSTAPHRDDGFSSSKKTKKNAVTTASTQRVGARPALPPKVKVMITGYGDFMGVYKESEGRLNPSGVLARRLAEMGLQNAEVQYRKLEVTTAAVDAFMAEMKANPPDVIISMGVSSKAQVEARPENWLASNEDGRGEMMRERTIDLSRPAHERIATDLPVHAIERAIVRAVESGALTGATIGTPLRPGEGEAYAPDDSAYLCNYLNYNLTHAFGADDKVTAGFVHVTAQTSAQEMREVVQAVVNQQLSRIKDAAPPPQS